MVFKIIRTLFFLIFNIHIAFGEVIYSKNYILITKIELIEFKNFYVRNYGEILTENQALKQLVLLKKIINFYNKNNQEIIDKIDLQIKDKIDGVSETNDIEKDFLRFAALKNEFIVNYFRINFKQSDLEKIFNIIGDVSFNLSKDGCFTIVGTQNLLDNQYFLNNLYTNLINGTSNFKTNINSDIYDVCISNKEFKKIEKAIIKYIEVESKSKFDAFIYEKLE